MLLEKKIESGDIITIKLLSGEEMMAKLISENQDSITISKPVLVNVGADRAGNVGIQMVPYFVLTADPDSRFEIKNSHILVRIRPNEQARNGYLQNTTGLSVVSGSTPGSIIT